jgi:hypothetical protein
MSISFDIKLFNGQSIRHPNADEFIDDICQRLYQAIEVYEKTTLSQMKILFFSFKSFLIFLVNISDQNVEINLEARQAINFIETGKHLNI